MPASSTATVSATRWPAFAATAVFVLLNHLLLAIMLRLARGHTFHESGLFSFESLNTDS